MENLETLLAPLPSPIGDLTRRLVAMLAAHPGLDGRVMAGWRSVNFHHPRAGFVCGVFPRPEQVVLYFEQGRLLAAEEELPLGQDLKRGRFRSLQPEDDLPIDAIGILVTEAIALFC